MKLDKFEMKNKKIDLKIPWLEININLLENLNLLKKRILMKKQLKSKISKETISHKLQLFKIKITNLKQQMTINTTNLKVS